MIITWNYWDILVVILLLPVHELGHYWIAWLLKYNPKIKICALWVEVQVDKSIADLKGTYLVILTGVIAGGVWLWFSSSDSIFFVLTVGYIAACAADLVNLVMLPTIAKKYGWKTKLNRLKSVYVDDDGKYVELE